jgi:hypothetical protein
MFQKIKRFVKFVANHWKKILFISALVALGVGLSLTGIGAVVGLSTLAFVVGIPIFGAAVGTGLFATISKFIASKLQGSPSLNNSETEPFLRPTPDSDGHTPKQQNLPVHSQTTQAGPSTDSAKGWRDLLAELLKKIKRDPLTSKSYGIDTAARRVAIHRILESGGKLPEYITAIEKTAGNILITTDAPLSTIKSLGEDKYNEEIKQRVGETKVIQNGRYDQHGHYLGHSLYGGLAQGGVNPQRAAVANAVAKLNLSSKDGGNIREKLDSFFDGLQPKLKVSAYSVYDIGYLIDKFLPKPAFLEALRNERRIDADTYQYYSDWIESDKTKYFERNGNDDKSLRLAVSNTYHLDLDEKQATELSGLLDPQKKSDVYFGMSYQVECCTLLSCLYPQKYYYRHEFYCGILPVLKDKLNDTSQFIGCLQQATRNIITKMKEELRSRLIPSQIDGLTIPEDAFIAWKNLVEINITNFMWQYPGMPREVMCNILGVDNMDDVTAIDTKLQQIWDKERDEIIKQLKNLDNPIISEGIIAEPVQINSEVNHYTRQETNQARLAALKSDAVEGLINSPIMFEVYEEPLIASDVRIYDVSEYREFRTSPFTKQELNGTGFRYIALQEFCNNYKRDPSSQQTHEKLWRLCQDMVTGEIMKWPIIANLNIQPPGLNNQSYNLVVVCDEKTLLALSGCSNILPGYSFKYAAKRDFSELEDVIKKFNIVDQGRPPSPIYSNDWNQYISQLSRDHLPPMPSSSHQSNNISLASNRSAFLSPPQGPVPSSSSTPTTSSGWLNPHYYPEGNSSVPVGVDHSIYSDPHDPTPPLYR